MTEVRLDSTECANIPGWPSVQIYQREIDEAAKACIYRRGASAVTKTDLLGMRTKVQRRARMYEYDGANKQDFMPLLKIYQCG